MVYDQMYKLLFQAVQEGSVKAVQQAASQIFGSAVSVTDNAFRVLSADADPGSTDDMLEKNGNHVYVSGELLDLFREHDLVKSLSDRPHETIVVDWGYFKDHPHLTTGIFWENHILGSITVLVDSKEYTGEQHEALQACADALAMVLHNNEYGKKKLSAEKDHFISKLFHGSVTPKDLKSAEKNHYFRRSSRYVVLATEFIPDQVWERLNEDHFRILFFHEEGITYLLSGVQSKELPELERWIANRGHRYGLSYTFSDPLVTGRMAKQAAAALEYGSRSGQRKAEWAFPECALDMMIQMTPDSSDFIHPGILEMEQYDAENHTQYLETLKTWLMHKMDYSATAKAMNLHRNSLYYRMQRILELFDIDFENMNTDVQLYLTLCADHAFSEDDSSPQIKRDPF